MQIHGPLHVHGAQGITAPHLIRGTAAAGIDASPAAADEVQISEAGRLLDKIRDLPDIRGDRVAEIRAQIAHGAYETDAKLQVALERLLDELG